jgi:hypothetical protein
MGTPLANLLQGWNWGRELEIVRATMPDINVAVLARMVSAFEEGCVLHAQRLFGVLVASHWLECRNLKCSADTRQGQVAQDH